MNPALLQNGLRLHCGYWVSSIKLQNCMHRDIKLQEQILYIARQWPLRVNYREVANKIEELRDCLVRLKRLFSTLKEKVRQSPKIKPEKLPAYLVFFGSGIIFVAHINQSLKGKMPAEAWS